LSRSLLTTGDALQSEVAAREGLRVFQEIAADDPNNYEAARDVLVAHVNLAKALAAQNRDASEEFEAVLSDYAQLHRRNPDDRGVEVIVESRDWLAGHALATGNRPRAIAQYRRNIKMLEDSSDAENIVRLGLDQELLGNALRPVDNAGAMECYKRALILWDKLRDSHSLPPMFAGRAQDLRQKIARWDRFGAG
jgi:tetratricopeptide (TPR) repeat protein